MIYRKSNQPPQNTFQLTPLLTAFWFLRSNHHIFPKNTQWLRSPRFLPSAFLCPARQQSPKSSDPHDPQISTHPKNPPNRAPLPRANHGAVSSPRKTLEREFTSWKQIRPSSLHFNASTSVFFWRWREIPGQKFPTLNQNCFPQSNP